MQYIEKIFLFPKEENLSTKHKNDIFNGTVILCSLQMTRDNMKISLRFMLKKSYVHYTQAFINLFRNSILSNMFPLPDLFRCKNNAKLHL